MYHNSLEGHKLIILCPAPPPEPISAVLEARSSPLKMNGPHYSNGGKCLNAMLLKCNAGSLGLSLYISFTTYIKGSTLLS